MNLLGTNVIHRRTRNLVFCALDVVQSQLQARKLGGMASTRFRLLEANDSVFPELNWKLPDKVITIL
jgi:hypothetical protein